MNITKEDKITILQMTEQRIAELCNELNSYGKPAEFPQYWDEFTRLRKLTPREYTMDNILSKLHKFAKENCSRRLASRLRNKDMTDEEHDDFWEGNYGNDKEALERSTIRDWKNIATEYKVADQVDWDNTSRHIQDQLCAIMEDK